MSNSSLKDQLQAVASQLSDTPSKKQVEKKTSQQRKNRPKPRWLDYVQYGVELLKAYFPTCFKSTNEIKPLKKGIKQDLIKRLSTMDMITTADKACMVKSIAYYVNTAAYYKNVTEGIVRIDLDGDPSGVVTIKEATYSLERYQEKINSRQTQKQPVLTQVCKENANVPMSDVE